MTESVLYEIWKKQDFKNGLKTISGEDIVVLDTGNHNNEIAGPDFKNARIRIGNLTYIGDIEIDNDYSDWKAHGHNIDVKYSKVILHITFSNKNNYSHVYTRDGRKVSTICLSDFIDEAELEVNDNETAAQDSQPVSNLRCASNIASIPKKDKENFLQQLGTERFQKKCSKIYERLKELQFINELNLKEPVISYDLSHQFQERKFKHSDFESKEIWKQLFYELVFEALGYSKNKYQMMTLAQAANMKFLSHIESDGVLLEKYEAALFYIGGLMQKKECVTEKLSSDYIEKLELHWNSIKPFYDGKYFDEAQWHFFRLRPQNFPTIRIAGGARVIHDLLKGNLIGTMVKKITEIYNLTVLINSIRSLFVIKAEGFWKNHYVLDQPASSEIKYFVGASRADEIVVNVVLPFFTVYFDVFGNQNMSKKVLKLYNLYQQKSENQIINDMSVALLMTEHAKRTVYAQGMIELFRNFCSKNKCLECEIGKVMFN